MRVLIADDHALFRDGLRSLLEARGVDVVAEARDGAEALDLARLHNPDIVLMDLQMPGTDGLTATRLLAAALPAVKVVVVTASEEDADLFEAIKSGAQGYLHKNLEADRLFAMLEGVLAGEPALTPGLARKVLQALANPAPVAASAAAAGTGAPAGSGDSPDALTPRELEVLELLVAGVTSNRDLADRLSVSENTVKYHLRQILQKLHLQNRAQVVSYALRHGLVPPGDAARR